MAQNLTYLGCGDYFIPDIRLSYTDPFRSVPKWMGYGWSNDTAFYKKTMTVTRSKVILMVFVTSYLSKQRQQPAVLRSVLPNVRVISAVGLIRWKSVMSWNITST